MEYWSSVLELADQKRYPVTVLLALATGNWQLAGTLKQQRNVKWQDADQTAVVVPGFVKVKAPVRGPIG
jgi:hypothetical protein